MNLAPSSFAALGQPLVVGAILPTALLVAFGVSLSRLVEKNVHRVVNKSGLNIRQVTAWSLASGTAIVATNLFALPAEISILIVALFFSLAAAIITWRSQQVVKAALVTVAIIGGMLSAYVACMLHVSGAFGGASHLSVTLAVWPILGGPALVAALISAALAAYSTQATSLKAQS